MGSQPLFSASLALCLRAPTVFENSLTQRVTIICTGSEGGFRGWGQNDTSWSYPWYEVSKNVFAEVVLSLVAEFQKLLKIMPFLGEISSKVSWVICWARDQNFFFLQKVYTCGSFCYKNFGGPMFTSGARPFVHFCKQMVVYPLRTAPNLTWSISN